MNEGVAIPGGGLAIIVSVRGMCSTYFENWKFTPEGQRIYGSP
jgi:hypothetical protein